jgi:hypothetical protein
LKKNNQYKRSYFTPIISGSCFGIEPSAILTFRDEYIRLADDTASAEKLAKNCLTIEEFFKSYCGKIRRNNFLRRSEIKIHGHCHQNHLVQ